MLMSGSRRPITTFAWARNRITVGYRKNGRIPVKTYREILHHYLYHPECKFTEPDANPCDPWTCGMMLPSHYCCRFQILWEGSQTQAGTRPGRSRDRLQVQSVRERASGGRSRDSTTTRGIFRTRNKLSDRTIATYYSLYPASWVGESQYNATDPCFPYQKVRSSRSWLCTAVLVRPGRTCFWQP